MTIVEVATHKAIGEIPFSNVVRPIALSQDEKRLYAEVDGLVGLEVADTASRIRRASLAGMAAAPGSVIPSASAQQAMVLAVPITMQ